MTASGGGSLLSLWPILLAADAGTGPGVNFIFIFGALFAIWYFLLIRPQQNQRRKLQQLLSNLKTGDRVVTTGGIYGTVVGFRNGVVRLQVAPQVQIDVARSAISGLAAEGEEAQPVRREADARGKKS